MPARTDPPEEVSREPQGGPMADESAHVARAASASRRSAPSGMPAGQTPLPNWTGFDAGGLKARLDNLEARVGRIQGNYVDKSEATLRAIQTTAAAIAILLGIALTLLEISRLV